jgi:hypothetical protein
MQQEDWLIRQINQLGRALGKILADLLGLKALGRVSEGIETADKNLISELDLNMDALTAIPTELFIKTLQEGKQFSNDMLEMLADIFLIIAEEFEQSGKDEEKKKKLYERSLTIYEYLDKTSATYSFERHYKIERIRVAR